MIANYSDLKRLKEEAMKKALEIIRGVRYRCTGASDNGASEQCELMVTLGDFSKLVNIKRHWTVHVTRKDIGKDTCSQLLKRLDHIKKKGDSWLIDREVEDMIGDLNSISGLRIPSGGSAT